MTLRMDIDALQALCAIEDQGGITRAADHLALSQSAVSHKIKRLEDKLGRTLLTRRPGAPTFSEDGRALLTYARRILALHDEAVLHLTNSPLTGHLRLGMTEDTTSGGLSRILARFARLHPDVSVRTHVSQSLSLMADLEQGEIDLAIMQIFAHETRPGDIALFHDHLHWVASPDLPLPDDRPLPFLAFDDNCFYKHWAMTLGQAGGRDFRTVLQCASNAGIVSAVEAGLGIALLNARHITPRMTIIDPQIGAPPPDIAYVVRIARKSRAAPARALAEEIQTEARGQNVLQAV